MVDYKVRWNISENIQAEKQNKFITSYVFYCKDCCNANICDAHTTCCSLVAKLKPIPYSKISYLGKSETIQINTVLIRPDTRKHSHFMLPDKKLELVKKYKERWCKITNQLKQKKKRNDGIRTA